MCIRGYTRGVMEGVPAGHGGILGGGGGHGRGGNNCKV